MRLLFFVVVAIPHFLGLATTCADDRVPRFPDGRGLVTTLFQEEMYNCENMVLQSDGRIVLVGNLIPLNEGRIGVARYLPNGMLDHSFGSGGKVSITLGDGGRAKGVAVQRNGKIIIGGEFITRRIIDAANRIEENDQDFALVQCNSDGALDTHFGSGGRVRIATTISAASAMALRDDGKIVLAGVTWSDLSNRQDWRFALARYNETGTFDKTFGSRGRIAVKMSDTGRDHVNTIALQSDGKVILGGWTGFSLGFPESTGHKRLALARFTSDGKLDRQFGRDGRVIADFNDYAEAENIAVQADGKIVVAGITGLTQTMQGIGQIFGVGQSLRLWRFNVDGTPDTSFRRRP